MEILGIDIGGTGIKGAPVDVQNGTLAAPRYRLPTPSPSKPKAVAKTVDEIVKSFNWNGPVGCGFPSVVRHGVVLTAANIHKSWIGTNASELFSQATGCPVVVLNDADAAGVAEMAFGAGREHKGTVIIVTIGTGLGTAVFTDGKLYPNAELGHILLNGEDAELWASDAARKQKKMTWKNWAKYFDAYLNRLEFLLRPDIFILGGGISKQAEEFLPYLKVEADVIIAQLLNEAGIVGAAMAAHSLLPAQPDTIE